MKRLLAILLAVAVIAALMAVPAAAQTDVDTSVSVLSGAGADPVVKAKWESTASNPASESGDPIHSTTGTQVLPNIGFQVTTAVWFWAVVTDPTGVANISHVYADVYNPDGTLKFEIELTSSQTGDPAMTKFDLAVAADLVTLNPDPIYTQAEIDEELHQQSAKLYWGSYTFDNCQLAGDYLVTIDAVNLQNVHGNLSNTLRWEMLTAAEFDFSAVNYGQVNVGVHKQIDGNQLWSLSGVGPSTIRNIGNTYLNMTVKQDDMAFGKTASIWNVHYDTRLGAGVFTNYDPAVVKGGDLLNAPATIVSPQILDLCALEKVDFSILVDKDPNSLHAYDGLMMLGAQYNAGPSNIGTQYLPPATPPTET